MPEKPEVKISEEEAQLYDRQVSQPAKTAAVQSDPSFLFILPVPDPFVGSGRSEAAPFLPSPDRGHGWTGVRGGQESGPGRDQVPQDGGPGPPCQRGRHGQLLGTAGQGK